MSLISGCIRRYSEAEGAASDSFGTPGFKSRALIPVALPRPSPSSGTAILCNKWTVSNVPGPQESVKIAGVGLRSVHFAFSNIMPQVGVVSLDGKMAINFVIDPISVPDSLSLSTHFLGELEALVGALGLEVSGEISALKAEADALAGVMKAALSA
ncbi:unnamed protein product [Hapterophycus canaliculatus]